MTNFFLCKIEYRHRNRTRAPLRLPSGRRQRRPKSETGREFSHKPPVAKFPVSVADLRRRLRRPEGSYNCVLVLFLCLYYILQRNYQSCFLLFAPFFYFSSYFVFAYVKSLPKLYFTGNYLASPSFSQENKSKKKEERRKKKEERSKKK